MAEPAPAVAARERPRPPQRRPARPATPTPAPAGIPPAVGRLQLPASGGEPLAPRVAATLQASLGVDLSAVRVHTDTAAAEAAQAAGARAFTVGNRIFLGRNERATDLTLIAHEVAHAVQQRGAELPQPWRSPGTDRYEQEAHRAAAAVTRSEPFTVRERTRPTVQRLGLSDALDYFADKANLIPGFRMFTVVLGVNPINMSRVERSPANLLRAVIELIPGGGLITQALDNHGIVDRVALWVEQQIRTLGMTGGMIREGIDRFLDSLSWRDIFDLGGVWERAKRIFTEPIGRLISFGTSLVAGVVRFIKEAILRPLARLAEGTRGYDLLKAVLGRDPITGEQVPQTAETLIGGFMKLIGQEQVWENIKKGNAIGRAWAWFRNALGGLLGFVRQIPTMFLSALQSLELMDIVLVGRAFAKVVGVFVGLAGRFFSWAGEQVMSLLQIIFEVVAPAVMPYLRKAMGAFREIIRNPVRFIGNLVRAGVQGFRQFAAKFLDHLRAALIGWLTGAMSGANIYIPQAFELKEIIKFVLSVLALTWQAIRSKLVRVIGETAVTALETTFDIVVTLVTEGPAAAWDKIREQISNLREMVMEQVMTFVRDRIVQAAITKLVTSLNPAGAFIQAIIAIYNTVMFVVERLRQIGQVVASFIDSISAIASGAIGAAANRVEQTMAGLLTLVISFLARLVGLGKVSDVVVNIVNRIRAPIDRALDKVVEWVMTAAKKLGRLVAQAGVPQDPNERLRLGMQTALSTANRFAGRRVGKTVLEPLFGAIKLRYGFRTLELVSSARKWGIRGVVNPEDVLISNAEIEEGPANAAPTRIQQLLGLRNQGGVEIQVSPGKYYGRALERRLTEVHRLLISSSVEERRVAIEKLRLSDKIWSVLQGMIYAPFVGEQQQAVEALREEATGEPFIYSLDRGGTLLAEQVVRGSKVQVVALPKVRIPQRQGDVERMVTSKTRQVDSLKQRILSDLSGAPDRPTVITITETMVGGGSVNALVNMANEIVAMERFPNTRFKILALQQTMQTESVGAGVVELRQRGLVKADRVQVIAASVQYILGEDVSYQSAASHQKSKSPVILFKPTGETMFAYQIIPVGDTTAKDIIIDLVDGKYNGKLPNVL